MRTARAGVAAALRAGVLAALAGLAAPPRAQADEPSGQPRGDAYPLVFLAQGDAVVDSTPAGGNDPPDAGSHLRLRRLRVGEDLASGAWHVRAVLEAQDPDEPFAPVEGGRLPRMGAVRLPEAFVSWRPDRTLALTAGVQRAPFSLSRQVDEADLRLPERAQAVVGLAPDYRAGVALASDFGLLDVRAAFMSADTSVDGRLFGSGAFGALRLGADPIGPMGTTPWRRAPSDPWYNWWRFSAGVSVLYGTLVAPRTLGFGGDAQLQWRGVTITGEYLAHHLPSPSSPPLPSQGAVFEPGVFLVDQRFELALRGAWYHEPGASGETDTLAGGGALTFFARDAHLRVQAGLELRRTLDHRLPDSSWGIIRATLAL